MVFWVWTKMGEISVCSSVSSRCVSLNVLLAGASHLVTCERLPRGDAIWTLARVACQT
jgi:hypothetical protein